MNKLKKNNSLRNIWTGLRKKFSSSKTNPAAFTLVELIIVIAIIAVLAVSAFMMLTKWLGKSRDSRRLWDLKTIQTGLDVWFTDVDMWNGYYPYPDIKDQPWVVTLYSWDLTTILAYQGIVDLEVAKLANLQKVPLDPTDKNEYTYSVTANFKKFQVMAMLEDGSEATAMINQIYAQDLDYRNRVPRVVGYNLGVLMKSGTNMPIQFVGATLTGINLSDDAEIGAYIAQVEDGEEPVVGTGIQELEIYLGWTTTTTSGDTGASTPSSPDITSTDCSDAWWMWVSGTDDVYIGTSQWDGFCISPRVWDFGDSTWNGISWNGWWNQADWNYGWWDSSPIDDTGNPYPEYGQTRRLDSSTWYTCKLLWSSDTDFDTTDNIVWRMKWLATNKANLTELKDIEWVQNAIPPNWHPIPALYIADCIDGVKDLWTDMEYKHYPDENLNETITYTQYNTDESSNTDTAALTNETYQNRQKYLTAWTQKSGSHLPSAYSYIESETAGGEYSTISNARWEYQVACELWKFGTYSSINQSSTNDQEAQEWIWLSSIGGTTGSNWGRTARIVGSNGCGDQNSYNTGYRYGNRSARSIL